MAPGRDRPERQPPLLRGGRPWRAPIAVPLADGSAGDNPDPDPPQAVGLLVDRLLAGLGAPPADTLALLYDHWSTLAGQPLADHGMPANLDQGVLSVDVDDPMWATEWRYRQGEVLARCDALLGVGVINRIRSRVRPQR